MAKTALECGVANPQWTGRDSRCQGIRSPKKSLTAQIHGLDRRIGALKGGSGGGGCGAEGPSAGACRPPLGSGPGRSGSRTKAQVSAVPRAQSATRTQVEPAMPAANELPPSSSAWKTAPLAASAIVPGHHPVHRQHAGGDAHLLGRHRRHRRGRHRRVDEAERDAEEQVAEQAAGRSRCPPRAGSARAARPCRRPCRRSSAAGRRSGRSGEPRAARSRPSAP